MSNIRQHVINLAKEAPISKKVFDSLTLNSYERNYLIEHLSDTALLELCKSTMKNVSTRFGPTYEDLIVHKLLPEVTKRLEEKYNAP